MGVGLGDLVFGNGLGGNLEGPRGAGIFVGGHDVGGGRSGLVGQCGARQGTHGGYAGCSGTGAFEELPTVEFHRIRPLCANEKRASGV